MSDFQLKLLEFSGHNYCTRYKSAMILDKYKAATDKSTARKLFCTYWWSSPLPLMMGIIWIKICDGSIWIHEQVPGSVAASCVLVYKEWDITAIFKKKLSDIKYQPDISHGIRHVYDTESSVLTIWNPGLVVTIHVFRSLKVYVNVTVTSSLLRQERKST